MKAIAFLSAFIVAGIVVAQPATQPTTQPTTQPKVRIVLVGDSTVTDKAGWANGFRPLLADEVELINTSRGGRSTKTFYNEGSWAKVLEHASGNCYVLIQFGHNDESKLPERHTELAEFRANLVRYVDEARSAGMKPVLLTPVCRRQFGDDGKIHSSLMKYADLLKEVAADKQTPLVDLQSRSMDLYNTMGKAAWLPPMAPTKDDGTTDNTHFTAESAALIGPLVADELRKAVPELAAFIRQAPPMKFVTVASDGSGDFATVQAAVDSAPARSTERLVIHIKPGTYKERVAVHKDKGPITFLGDGDPKNTVITWNYSANSQENGKNVGTSGSYSVLADANDFIAENITLENAAGEVGQAVALRTTGDRQTFRHCRMLGWQDTLYVHTGRQYFADCYVEGRVDFIFGKSTAVFDRCEIHSKNGGFVTAAATPRESPFGLVFLDCKLTGEGDPAYLGRPWRPDAAVAFIRSDLGEHIRPEGWSIWGGNENHKTARYSEYKNTGAGADRSKRVEWSKELTVDEAAKYTVGNILGGADHWKPN